MRRFFALTIAVIAGATLQSMPLHAADTWSSASLGLYHGGGSAAGGSGNYVHTNSTVGDGVSVGHAVATDSNSMSFSYSSALRAACRGIQGQSLHITVGPGTGSASVSHVTNTHAIQVSGQTTPTFASARGQGLGPGTSASQAMAFNRQSPAPFIRPLP